MKKSVGALALLSLLTWAAPGQAQEFKIFGSYWNTNDVDDAFGGGIGLGVPLGATPLSLAFSGTYYQELSDEPLENLVDDDEGVFQDEGLEVLPVDAGLHYTFPARGAFRPWVGAGFTYFLIDTTREGFDVDDETGFHVSVGSHFGQRTGANFFAEVLYRSTEATLVDERGDNVDLRDEVAIDLDGIAVNAGLAWRF